MIIATSELRKLSMFFLALSLSVGIACDALFEDTTKSKAADAAPCAMSPNTNTNK